MDLAVSLCRGFRHGQPLKPMDPNGHPQKRWWIHGDRWIRGTEVGTSSPGHVAGLERTR